jgi:hypothetical protein
MLATGAAFGMTAPAVKEEEEEEQVDGGSPLFVVKDGVLVLNTKVLW